jgi:hypothetical protein
VTVEVRQNEYYLEVIESKGNVSGRERLEKGFLGRMPTV